ncbi:N-acetylgalactosamine-6-sulfatase [Acipenser ruthenus]|uniref:N-acetylgalactosamine-6-sulfatase n=1 Tax=Acipenser ruthenus TaxID=7906 RepID=UPI0027407F49|nr:N-acetylgalactosamine-6-sulfatase [Acipenser ruthenus]
MLSSYKLMQCPRHFLFHFISILFCNKILHFVQGIDFCPGQRIPVVTSHKQEEHTQQPIIFHLGRDLGEKYPISVSSAEYQAVLKQISPAVEKHRKELVPGMPQLNMCDLAVMLDNYRINF